MTKHLLYNEQQDANSLAALKDIEFGVFDAQDRLFTLKVPFFTLHPSQCELAHLSSAG